MFKKNLCLFLALIMVAMVFGSCGQGASSSTSSSTASTTSSTTSSTASTTSSSTGPEAPTEITWFRYQLNNAAIVYWNDAEWIKELQRRTNTKIDFNGPVTSAADYVQAVQVMLASGDYPDLIFFNWNNYVGGLAQAIADGVVVDVGANEEYRKMMPTWYGILDSNEEIYRSVTLDDGTAALFCHVEENLNRAGYEGIAMREDWLTQVGKSAPTSIDELYDTLVAFKGLGDNVIPMTDWKDIWTLRVLMSAWGLRYETPYPDPETGKITYWTQYKNGEAFTDFVTTMNKWYKEGLLDIDFASQDGAAKDTKMSSGDAGTCFAWPGNYINWRDAIVAADPSKDATAHFYGLEALKGPAGKAYAANDALVRWAASTEGTCVTTTAEKAGKMEAILSMLDYMYTTEGSDLINFGVEGVSYTVNAEGKKEWTDLVTKDATFKFGDKVRQYALPSNGGWPKWMSYEAWYGIECQIPDQVRMHENYLTGDRALLTPNIVLNAADQDDYRRIKADVDTAVKEIFVNAIIGTRPLSDIQTVLDQVNKLGIDRAMEIYQVSYDRYYAK